MQAQDQLIKTIYVGGHDGQKWGEKPNVHHQPIPIQMDITHSQMVRIVNHLYAELQRITASIDDRGSWS